MKAVDTAFRSLLERFEAAVVATFDALPLGTDGLDLKAHGVRPPSSTWTYRIDDDPFRLSLGLHGSGDIGLSIGGAIHPPLYLAAALYKRLRRRR